MKIGIVNDEWNDFIWSYEKHFIEANKRYWKNSTPNDLSSNWIYTFHTYTLSREMSVLENIVAKGIQSKEHLPIIAISFTDYGKATDAIDHSFEIEPIHFGLEKNDHIIRRVYRFLKAAIISGITYGKKDRLFEIKYRKIACGDVIHDEIIRWCKGEYFDCFDISRKRYFEYLIYAFEVIDKAYKIFNKHKPKYFILNELCYIPGLTASVASFFGAKVLRVEPLQGSMMASISPMKTLYQEVKISDLIKKLIEYQIEQKIQIQETEDRFVIESKREKKSDLKKELGLNLKKKNIFIMLHALNDAPRCSSNCAVYNNYNDWFLDTVSKIKNINHVNWIIKDHPLSNFYVQEAYVKKIFDENKTSNMYWCDKTVSGLEIKEIADCVITCIGDVGIEYWSYGIPTVTLANAYYCNWGISYNIKNKEDYYQMLAHIEDVQKPTSSSIEKAKQCINLYKTSAKRSDELATLFTKSRNKEIKAYKDGNVGNRMLYYDNFRSFSETYINFLKEKDVKSSEFFLLQNLYEV